MPSSGALLFYRASVPAGLALLALFTLAFGVEMVVAARPDQRWHERTADFATNQTVRAWISKQARPQDIVLLDLQPVGYDVAGRAWEWTNFAPLYPDTIGWRRKPTLSQEDKARLRQWLGEHGRVWLMVQATDVAAPDSTTENWLRQWAYQGRNRWLGTQRVVEFVLPAPQSQRLAAGTTSWFRQNPLRLRYEVVQGRFPNHLLFHLQWMYPERRNLKFSLQALGPDGRVVAQVDRPLSGGDARVGMALDGTATLVIKVYDGASGEVFATQTGKEETATAVLVEVP